MISQILSECQNAGIILELDQDHRDQIRFAAPPGAMTENLKKQIAEHKQDIMEYLYTQLFDECLQSTIGDLDGAGVKMTAVSREIQRQTLELEHEITEAIKKREIDTFKVLVEQWKDLFLEKLPVNSYT